jgi:hypothetical protein
MRCPFCGSTVEPTRNAAGQLVCPLCGNTGRIAPAPPGAQSWTASPSPAGAAGAPYPSSSQWPPPAGASPSSAMGAPGRAPTKALLALIFGIAAFVLFPIAIILGPVALVLGIQALRQIKRMPPGTPGQGMAITGIVLGGIGIMVGITIVMAAIVFVLVSDLGTMGEWDFDVDASGVGGVLTVKDYPGTPPWSDFELGGTASCRLPTGDVGYGDEIVCTTDGSVILMDAATNQAVYNATV